MGPERIRRAGAELMAAVVVAAGRGEGGGRLSPMEKDTGRGRGQEGRSGVSGGEEEVVDDVVEAKATGLRERREDEEWVLEDVRGEALGPEMAFEIVEFIAEEMRSLVSNGNGERSCLGGMRAGRGKGNRKRLGRGERREEGGSEGRRKGVGGKREERVSG